MPNPVELMHQMEAVRAKVRRRCARIAALLDEPHIVNAKTPPTIEVGERWEVWRPDYCDACLRAAEFIENEAKVLRELAKEQHRLATQDYVKVEVK